jgi:hypothetical protein
VNAYKALLEQHYLKRGPSATAESMQQSLARADARAKLPMVPHTSPFWRTIAGSDGELWVERADLVKEPARIEYERTFPVVNRQLVFPEPDSRWDRFDSQGRFQGQITLPSNFHALAVHRGAVYGVSKNADDVEFVVRMRATPRL